MHIQQNSYLHWEQDMWLQPWFFSMRVWHFGQRFVLARIQFAVSDSFWHFSAHSANAGQPAGWWASSPHRTQKAAPQPPLATVHLTDVHAAPLRTILSQPAPGHHRRSLEDVTKFSSLNLRNRSKRSWSRSCSQSFSGTLVAHSCSGHGASTQPAPSWTALSR